MLCMKRSWHQRALVGCVEGRGVDVWGKVCFLRSRRSDSGAQRNFWRGDKDIDEGMNRRRVVYGSHLDVRAEVSAEIAAGAVIAVCLCHDRVSSWFVHCCQDSGVCFQVFASKAQDIYCCAQVTSLPSVEVCAVAVVQGTKLCRSRGYSNNHDVEYFMSTGRGRQRSWSPRASSSRMCEYPSHTLWWVMRPSMCCTMKDIFMFTLAHPTTL